MKQNIYCIIGGSQGQSKVLVASDVLASSYTDAPGAVHYYYVSLHDWLSFKSQSQYADKNLSHCLASGIVPGQCELVGGPFIIESV